MEYAYGFVVGQDGKEREIPDSGGKACPGPPLACAKSAAHALEVMLHWYKRKKIECRVLNNDEKYIILISEIHLMNKYNFSIKEFTFNVTKHPEGKVPSVQITLVSSN